MNALFGMAGDYSYDICINHGSDSEKIKSVVYSNDKVDEIVETYFVSDGKVVEGDLKIAIGGIEPDTYRKFNNYFTITGYKDKFYKNLNYNTRNMAINTKAAKLLNKNVGDTVTLKANNKEAEYKISGIFNAKLSPNQILINKNNMINDFNVTIPDSYNLLVKENVNEIKNDFKNLLKGTDAKVSVVEELKYE